MQTPTNQPVTILEGDVTAQGMRFAVVVSRWNEGITRALLDGALTALQRHGASAEDIAVARVPGSFEVPAAARRLAATGRFDAVVALGCVIRGATTHYEHIAASVVSGLGSAALDTGVPIALGVLTTETLEQALDRAGGKAGNKGAEAALAAIEMASLFKKIAGLSGAVQGS